MATRNAAPEPTVETLSNGATLINVTMPDDDNVGVFLMVRGGTRNETDDQVGLAHLQEHMFFKGSESRPKAEQIARAFRRLGGSSNAFTGREEIGYFVTGPAEHMLGLAEILTDMFTHPLFDAREVAKERNVVLEELATRSANSGTWLYDNAGVAAWGGDQPLGRPSTVEQRNVAGADRRRVVAYHQGVIAPENVALVVSGGARLTKAQAEALLKDIPRGTAQPAPPAVWGQGPEYVYKKRPALDGEIEQAVYRVMLPGFGVHDPDAPTADVLAALLGGGMASRLFLKIREKRALAYSVGAGSANLDDAGIFAFSALSHPDKAVEVVRRSLAELRLVAGKGVAADELAEVKEEMIGELLQANGSAAERGQFFAERWRAGLPLTSPRELKDQIRAITAADVQRVAKILVSRIPQVRLALVGPRDQGQELLDAARGRGTVLSLPHRAGASELRPGGPAAEVDQPAAAMVRPASLFGWRSMPAFPGLEA
jgi:predicted Zn-dependent peptidase